MATQKGYTSINIRVREDTIVDKETHKVSRSPKKANLEHNIAGGPLMH